MANLATGAGADWPLEGGLADGSCFAIQDRFSTAPCFGGAVESSDPVYDNSESVADTLLTIRLALTALAWSGITVFGGAGLAGATEGLVTDFKGGTVDTSDSVYEYSEPVYEVADTFLALSTGLEGAAGLATGAGADLARGDGFATGSFLATEASFLAIAGLGTGSGSTVSDSSV